MGTDRREFERIEQVIQRSAGDIAEALGRGLERLEDRIDVAEARIASDVAELANRESQIVGSPF